jgi:RNA polymerase sigma factor (sigma-70 family)
LAAAPSIGRASAVESPAAAPEADLTRDLYERYAGQIYGFCLHKLGSREEAEDAVQNTFLNAFRGLRRGVEPQAESAWLFKIAENVCLSRHRSSFRRGRVETPSDLQAIQDVLASPERRDDDLIGLEEALARMPESQRRAILLREWQGLSYREIAEEMELTQSAVETLIFRARRTLAQGLEDEPQTRRWKRLRQGADAGSVLALLKTLFTTGATVKAVATAVAVGSAVVAASSGGLANHLRAPHPPSAVSTPAASSSSPAFATASSPSAIAPVGSSAAPARASRRSVKPAASVTPASTVGSIRSIPGEASAPAATPAEPTPTPTPASTPTSTPTAQADPPRPVDTPQPQLAAPAANPQPAEPTHGLQTVAGTIVADPTPSPPIATIPAPPVAKNVVPAPPDSTPVPANQPVSTTPKPTADPAAQPKPVIAPVQTTVSDTGTRTGFGQS